MVIVQKTVSFIGIFKNIFPHLLHFFYRKPDLSMKLVNPLPLPHPIGISVIISNRDEFNRSHIKLDKLFSQSIQK